MRFTWTEEQELLRSTLRKYIDTRCNADYRRRRRESGFDAQVWSELADLGVLGLPFDTSYGGSGGTALDTLIVMEAFGRGLLLEPYLATVVLGGGLLRLAGAESQKAQLLPAVIAGKLRVCVAFTEEQSRFNLSNVTTRAQRTSDGDFLLRGHKIAVQGAPESHLILVVARTSGDPLDKDGVSLFLVPKESEGLQIRSYRCIDGTSAAQISLSGVRVPRSCLVGELDQALAALERVTGEALSAVCGEAVGAIAALLEKCVRYAQSRSAFGKPIGQFQAIGHRLVDMHVSHEQASAIAVKAALHLSMGSATSRTLSACKATVGKEAAFVGKAAVQLHGAIGITDELDVGHYFKRLTIIQTLFGSTAHHVRRYAELRAADEAHR